jgi:hypothetical protein
MTSGKVLGRVWPKSFCARITVWTLLRTPVNTYLYEQSCPVDLSYFVGIVTGWGCSWFISSPVNYGKRRRVVNIATAAIYLLLSFAFTASYYHLGFDCSYENLHLKRTNKCVRIKLKFISVAFEVRPEKTNKAIKKAFIGATSRHAS